MHEGTRHESGDASETVLCGEVLGDVTCSPVTGKGRRGGINVVQSRDEPLPLCDRLVAGRGLGHAGIRPRRMAARPISKRPLRSSAAGTS